MGDRGVPGLNGSTGPRGNLGPMGLMGANGTDGPRGPPGIDGTSPNISGARLFQNCQDRMASCTMPSGTGVSCLTNGIPVNVST